MQGCVFYVTFNNAGKRGEEFSSPNNPLTSPSLLSVVLFLIKELRYVRTSINCCPAPLRKTVVAILTLIT